VSANFSFTMCHSRRFHGRALERPAAPRRDPGLRASDEERESTVNQLRDHGAAGRLEVEELEQRVADAYAARTHGDLGALLTDLPGTTPAPRPVATHRAHGHDRGGFLPIVVLLVAIWAVTGAGYFWPAWVIVWWGFALAMKSGPRLLRLR
jgi:hypothetical protein